MKSKLLIYCYFIFSVSFSGCGGDSTGIYNPYAGSGIGSVRLKTITTSYIDNSNTSLPPDIINTKTFFYADMPLGKLDTIIDSGFSFPVTRIMEYNAPENRLSKIHTTFKTVISEDTFIYGATIFEPTGDPIVSESIRTSSIENGSAEISFSYEFNNSGNATRLKAGITRSPLVTINVAYNYDTIGRLTDIEILTENANDFISSFAYDSFNRIKTAYNTTTYKNNPDLNFGATTPLPNSETREDYFYVGDSSQLTMSKEYFFDSTTEKWEQYYIRTYQYESGACFYHYPEAIRSFMNIDVSLQGLCPH